MQEQFREVARSSWRDQFVQDLQYAWRALRRSPLSSAVAIGCLAMGIGVNVSAFSVTSALLLGEYPGVSNRRELMTLKISQAESWGRTGALPLSELDWQAFERSMPALENVSVTGSSLVALGVSQPRVVRADFASGRYFTLLQTRAALGRLLTISDNAVDATPVVVIGHDLWVNQFERDSAVIGRALDIGMFPFTIVGVAPPGFFGISPGEVIADASRPAPTVFLPLSAASLVRVSSRDQSSSAILSDQWLTLVGRASGEKAALAAAVQAKAVAQRLSVMFPGYRRDTEVEMQQGLTAARNTAEEVRAVALVMVVPTLILLLTCANLANQLLARALQRSREIAVRLALGATRARIVRQLLVESLLVSAGAAAIGILVSRWLTDIAGTQYLAIPFRITLNARVLAFTVLLAGVTALAFGLVPALRATRTDLSRAMKAGGQTGSFTRSRLRTALVVLQVAGCVSLIAIAGVFTRANSRATAPMVDSGEEHQLVMNFNLNLIGYAEPAGRAFQAVALDRLRSIPEISAAGIADFAPMGSIGEQRIAVAGDAPESRRGYHVAHVNGDWFAARGIQAVGGRLFTLPELRGQGSVAVVDEIAARRLWPGASAIGQVIRIGEDSTASVAVVTGIVPTIAKPQDQQPEGVIIVPASAGYFANTYLYLRTKGNASALRTTIRDVMRLTNPALPITLSTWPEMLRANASPVFLLASAMRIMGTLALGLAALGLSAVLAFTVAQRRREIGIRMALGAGTAQITRMVLRESLAMSMAGAIIGSAVAVAVSIMLRALLFGLPPADPVAFAVSATIMLLVALAASAIPAWRAAKVNPLESLRAD